MLGNPAQRQQYDAEMREAAAAAQAEAMRAEAATRAAASGKGLQYPPVTLDELPPWALNDRGNIADFLILQCPCAPRTP